MWKCAELEPFTSRAISVHVSPILWGENYCSEGTLSLPAVNQLNTRPEALKDKKECCEEVVFCPPASLFSCRERVGAKMNVVWAY